MVTATPAVDLQSNLDYYMDCAAAGENIIVTRPSRHNIVLISEEEYQELQRIRQNAEYMLKLKHSIGQAAQGKIVVKSMEELEAMANG